MHLAEHISLYAPPPTPGPESIRSVVQPIVRLDDRMVIGYEALARVDVEPARGPDWWLDQAEVQGTRTRLEADFLASAARLGPPPGDALLFVNASPAALADPSLLARRASLPERLVLEITEQAAVDDYDALKDQLVPWVNGGARLAIDDTGAGYSSLRHVVELVPDFLKLDRTLVCDIDKDPHRNALVRALVAFAREVGTSVIAEGIETPAQLAALVAAEVTLGQGFLLGRPGPTWTKGDTVAPHPSSLGRDASVRTALTKARTPSAACDAVVAHLFRLGQMIPSLYLEQHGQLRCVAQRGLWQVLDGLAADTGITGRVWSTGQAIEAGDVAHHPYYLEAVPGVMAEICVPVRIDGTVVGALNVDSLSPFPAGTLRHLQDCATLLSRRLSALGWTSGHSPWQRAVHGSAAISAAAADHDAADRVLATLLEASGMDSAGMIRADDETPRMRAAIGPLAPTLWAMDTQSLESVCRLVEGLSSCYTGREVTGLPYLGSEALREGGARAVVLLPLRAGNVALGVAVLAHSRTMRLTADLVEPLELLAGQAAATLKAVDLVDQLRRQARHDGLTGLLNRSALENALDVANGSPVAVLVADIDHFKKVNDTLGHPAGDHALQALAGRLVAVLPDVAFYRMGGDEVTCLVPGDDPVQAEALAQTVLGIGAEVLAEWGTELSVGGAVSLPGETTQETLVRADAALLWAKDHARGRVHM